jgi:hypothetical protein
MTCLCVLARICAGDQGDMEEHDDLKPDGTGCE